MSNSALVATSGTMTSGIGGVPVRAADFGRRLEDGAGLHLGDLRIGDREPHAAMAEHRIEFMQLGDPVAHRLGVGVERVGDLVDLGIAMRQEFMQAADRAAGWSPAGPP